MRTYGAAADFAFRRNASALAAGFAEDRKLHIKRCRLWVPSPGTPLKPSAVTREACAIASAEGADAIRADNYYRDALIEYVSEAGLAWRDAPSTTTDIAASYTLLRFLTMEQRLRIEDDDEGQELVTQLKGTQVRYLDGGVIKISHKTRKDGGHGDAAAAAAVLAWDLQGSLGGIMGEALSDPRMLTWGPVIPDDYDDWKGHWSYEEENEAGLLTWGR